MTIQKDFFMEKTISKRRLKTALSKLLSISTKEIYADEWKPNVFWQNWEQIMKKPPAIAVGIYNHVQGDFSCYIELTILNTDLVQMPLHEMLRQISMLLKCKIIVGYQDLNGSPFHYALIYETGRIQHIYADIATIDGEVKIETFGEEVNVNDLVNIVG
jgi:hypothetical protein